MIKLIVATTGLAILSNSCSNQVSEAVEVTNQEVLKRRVNHSWWRQLNDSALNQDVSVALANSPSLKAIALRSEVAESAVAASRATTLPTVNLGFGYQEGRKREADFGPYDLSPWQSKAGLSWEIDISGKLKAAKNAAVENKNATIWDTYASRLILSSSIAKVRNNLYRLNSEISNVNASLVIEQRLLSYAAQKNQAGISSDSDLYKQQAEVEKTRRTKLDLERLRDIAVVQLRTLRGGSQPNNRDRKTMLMPKQLVSKPLNVILASHPSILAAEARVRSAFQLQTSARLELLPSFQMNLLASGSQKSLVERFSLWTLKAGPSMNVPIYDPVRIATLNAKRAKAKIAAQNYKDTVLNVLAEIDTARINLSSWRTQLTTMKKQVKAELNNKLNASEQFNAGVISQMESLITERRWLEASRREIALRQKVLSAHIDLIKATGGGSPTR